MFTIVAAREDLTCGGFEVRAQQRLLESGGAFPIPAPAIHHFPDFYHPSCINPHQTTKMADNLPLQLQSLAVDVQSFITRFLDHIDPESGPVKGT